MGRKALAVPLGARRAPRLPSLAQRLDSRRLVAQPMLQQPDEDEDGGDAPGLIFKVELPSSSAAPEPAHAPQRSERDLIAPEMHPALLGSLKAFDPSRPLANFSPGE